MTNYSGSNLIFCLGLNSCNVVKLLFLIKILWCDRTIWNLQKRCEVLELGNFVPSFQSRILSVDSSARGLNPDPWCLQGTADRGWFWVPRLPRPLHLSWMSPRRRSFLHSVCRSQIRIRSDPELFAGSGSAIKISDPDPELDFFLQTEFFT